MAEDRPLRRFLKPVAIFFQGEGGIKGGTGSTWLVLRGDRQPRAGEGVAGYKGGEGKDPRPGQP